jgi:hypothetical protein
LSSAILRPRIITASRKARSIRSAAAGDCISAAFTAWQAGHEECGGSAFHSATSIGMPVSRLAISHSGPIWPGR